MESTAPLLHGDVRPRKGVGKEIFRAVMKMRRRNKLFWFASVFCLIVTLICYTVTLDSEDEQRNRILIPVDGVEQCLWQVRAEREKWVYTPNTEEVREFVLFLVNDTGRIQGVDSVGEMRKGMTGPYDLGIEIRGGKNVYFYGNQVDNTLKCLARLTLSHSRPDLDNTSLVGGTFVYWIYSPRTYGALAVVLLASGSAAVVAIMAYDMMTFFSTNAFALLVMNGASKLVVGLAVIGTDAICMVVLALLQALELLGEPVLWKSDFVFILFGTLMLFINLYLQFCLIVPIRHIIAFVSLVLTLMFVNTGISVFYFLFDVWIPLYAFRIVMLLWPAFTFSLLVDNLWLFKQKGFQTWKYMGYGYYITNWECILWFIASNVCYLIIVTLMNVFIPFYKTNVHWGSIFKKSRFSRFLRRHRGNNGMYMQARDEPVQANAFLSVKNVDKTYKSSLRHVQALNNVSFSLRRSESALLVGPNGSGKTTLVKVITGILGIDSGQIFLDGSECEHGVHHFRDGIGICFQEDAFIPRLTVEDHLRVMAAIRGIDKFDVSFKIEEISDMLDIRMLLPMKPQILSAGQKRKVSVALALLGSPKMIVLDEPTVGVDVQARVLIWKALSTCRDSTTIITSHSFEEAVNVVDRIIVLQQGTVAIQGSPEQLRHDCLCGYILKLTGDNIPGRINDILDFIRVRIPGATILDERANAILLPHGRNIHELLVRLESAKDGLGIRSYRLVAESLENVIIRLVSASEDQHDVM